MPGKTSYSTLVSVYLKKKKKKTKPPGITNLVWLNVVDSPPAT